MRIVQFQILCTDIKRSKGVLWQPQRGRLDQYVAGGDGQE